MKGYVIAIGLVVILAVMAICIPGCSGDGTVTSEDTVCANSDTTSVCDGVEFHIIQ